MRQGKFWLFVLLLFTTLALSQNPLSQLRQALEKEKKMEWQGKQVYSLYTKVGVLRFEVVLKKAQPDKTRLEFLSPPTFTGYVMVWERESVAIIPPKGKKTHFLYFAPGESMEDIHKELLFKSAKVNLRGEEQIIGRTAKIFLIEPTYVKGGYLKVWVDKETGIRLKTERYSPQGKLISSVALLSLQLNPTFEEKEFEVPRPLVKPRDYTPEELKRLLGFLPLLPSYLPPGYTLLHIRPLFAGRQRAAIIHLTDGLNPITIMETIHPWRHPPLFGHYEQEVVLLRIKEYSVALMGNVAREVLEKIGLSLK